MSEEAISLYFGLEDGSGPDMEIIGRCFVQLSSAIKKCPYLLDTNIEIRIKVVRERDGSVIIDFIVRSIKKIAGDKLTLSDLTIFILCLIGTDLRQYVDSKLPDKIFAPNLSTKEDTSKQDVDKERMEKIRASWRNRPKCGECGMPIPPACPQPWSSPRPLPERAETEARIGSRMTAPLLNVAVPAWVRAEAHTSACVGGRVPEMVHLRSKAGGDRAAMLPTGASVARARIRGGGAHGPGRSSIGHLPNCIRSSARSVDRR